MTFIMPPFGPQRHHGFGLAVHSFTIIPYYLQNWLDVDDTVLNTLILSHFYAVNTGKFAVSNKYLAHAGKWWPEMLVYPTYIVVMLICLSLFLEWFLMKRSRVGVFDYYLDTPWTNGAKYCRNRVDFGKIYIYISNLGANRAQWKQILSIRPLSSDKTARNFVMMTVISTNARAD